MKFSNKLLTDICKLENLKSLSLTQMDEEYCEAIDFKIIFGSLLNLESLYIYNFDELHVNIPSTEDCEFSIVENEVLNIGNLQKLKYLELINVTYHPSLALNYLATLKKLENIQYHLYKCVKVCNSIRFFFDKFIIL